MAKKQKKNYYFTQETEDAIVEYVNCDNHIKRNKIYNEKIDFPFFKLTQNIINTYKFPYMDGSIEDIQQECICHLLEKLDKYNQEKGKAYSYFGTTVLRYCINENNKAYKKITEKTNVNEVDEDKNIIIDLINDNKSLHNIIFDGDNYVLEYFIKYVEMHIEMITKSDTEYYICLAILDLLKKRENIEILEKKAIWLYLREATKKETPDITKVVKKLKKIYERLKDQYLEFGFISLNF